MRFTIQALPGYLRTEVVQQETADELRAIAECVFAEQAKSGIKGVLIVMRRSRPIFKVEQYKLSEILNRAAGIAGLRVALVSDTVERYASHEYVRILAGQRGVEVRSFREEASALKWLAAAPQKNITGD